MRGRKRIRRAVERPVLNSASTVPSGTGGSSAASKIAEKPSTRKRLKLRRSYATATVPTCTGAPITVDDQQDRMEAQELAATSVIVAAANAASPASPSAGPSKIAAARSVPRAAAAERWCLRGPVLLQPPAGTSCEGALVWLHGPGSNPEAWIPRLRKLWIQAGKYWKVILLRAPRLKLTCIGGHRFEAWGDLSSTECVHVGSVDYDNPDVAGHYIATVAQVHRCVRDLELNDGVLPDRVVIGGFSQGAACAMEAALQYPKPIAGCVALSGWLLPGAREALCAGPSHSMQCLVCHGRDDNKVGVNCARLAVQMLRGAGTAVTMKIWRRLGHSTSDQELALVGRFLRTVLSTDASEAAGIDP